MAQGKSSGAEKLQENGFREIMRFVPIFRIRPEISWGMF